MSKEKTTGKKTASTVEVFAALQRRVLQIENDAAGVARVLGKMIEQVESRKAAAEKSKP